MKRKLIKILGVGLAFVVIASLFGFAVPTSADPGNVVWERFPVPVQGVQGGYVLEATIRSTGPIASVGDTIYVAAWDDLNWNAAVNAGEIMIYKSVDGGCTWARTAYSVDTEVLGSARPAWQITDICIIDANTLYVTNGWDVFKTIDGGANWIPLTNLGNWFGWAVGSARITSIDVGVIGADTYVFAGASDFAAGGNGGAYVCWEWALGMPWHDLLIDTNRPLAPGGWGANTADVYDIRCDPNNFATTQAVLAIARYDGAGVCGAAAFTVFTAKHLGHSWNSYVGDATFLAGNVPLAYVAGIYRAQMWLPENFDYYLLAASGMEVFVGIASTVVAEGDVYWVIGGVPNLVPCPPTPGSFPFDLNIGGAFGAVEVTGLDGAGVSGAATLLAAGSAVVPGVAVPMLFRTATNGAIWFPNAKPPTGGAYPLAIGHAMPTVTVADDFATSGIAWVATHGANCGVSRTADFGSTSNTIGLISTDIDRLTDFSANSDGSVMFLATDDLVITGLVPFTGINSIWRFGGGNFCGWERIWSDTLSALGDTPDWVELSPDGVALFICDAALPVVGRPSIYRSLDLGQSFLPQVMIPGGNDGVVNPVQSWVVIDQNTVVIGSTVAAVGGILRTVNNGVIWVEIPAFTGVVVSSVVIAPGYTHPGAMLLGATTGTAALSPDGGTTWIPLPPTGMAAAPLYMAFDINYATNGFFYATGTSTVPYTTVGVVRYDAPLFAWTPIDLQGQGDGLANATALEFSTAFGNGILSTAGCGTESVLYVTDGAATAFVGVAPAIFAAGAMCRCLNPTANPFGPLPPYWENAREGLALAQNFGDITFAQAALWETDGVGSTTLWTIDATSADGGFMGLYNYTDTLADCVNLVSPADGDMIMEPMPLAAPWNVTLSWDALPGAIDYQVVVDRAPSFMAGLLPGEAQPVYIPGATSATFGLVRGVSENATFYWRVRVAFSANFPGALVGLGYGAPVRSYWSDVYSFTTSPAPPANIAINVMPMAGAQNVAVNTTFQWEEIWGASHYEWNLATDSTFATILDSQTPIDPFCQPAATLAYDTTYAWRVRAMADTTPLSDWVRSSFHTEIEPTGPVDVSDVTIPPVENITPAWIWAIIAIGAVLVIVVVILIWLTRQAR